jgi:hypothetical protein
MTTHTEAIVTSLKTAASEIAEERRAAERAHADQMLAFEAENRKITKALDALGVKYRRPGRPRKGE